MKIVFDEVSAAHDPGFEFRDTGEIVPHPECPERFHRIRAALNAAGLTDSSGPDPVSARGLAGLLQDPGLIDYLETAWRGSARFADSFALLRPRRPVRGRGARGYYCCDAQTPVAEWTWAAASASVAAAVTAVRLAAEGGSAAYALCRPPGHHAGRATFGGYCYLNNAAAAAQYAVERGLRPSIIDVDFHHGNGTQELFYRRGDVRFLSLHADPAWAYPFYAGFADERGEGLGAGANLNIPLPRECTEARYLSALENGLEFAAGGGTDLLIVSLGTDAYRDDPIGGLGLSVESFGKIGALIGSAGKPTAVIQEGGYHIETIGDCVTGFLRGISAYLT